MKINQYGKTTIYITINQDRTCASHIIGDHLWETDLPLNTLSYAHLLNGGLSDKRNYTTNRAAEEEPSVRIKARSVLLETIEIINEDS